MKIGRIGKNAEGGVGSRVSLLLRLLKNIWKRIWLPGRLAELERLMAIARAETSITRARLKELGRQSGNTDLRVRAITELLAPEIGVDLGFKGPTTMIILSKVGGGRVLIKELRVSDWKELTYLVAEMEARFGVKGSTWDGPDSAVSILQEETKRIRRNF